MEKPLAPLFKGSRDYLHGTDIYNKVITVLNENNSAVSEIDIAFHSLARTQLMLTTNQPVAGESIAATCAYNTSSKRQRVYLVETGFQVTQRYPYPEDEIVSQMVVNLEENYGELLVNPPFTDIEIWIAMTKSLHQKVFPQLSGKWLFVRGRFARYTEHSQAMARRISIVSCFNNKLTKSEATLDGCKVGEIYFSIV